MPTSPNRLVAIVVGAVYLLLGVLGFTTARGAAFFDPHGGLLFGVFGVNLFHDVVHLVIGAALLIAGISNVRAARTVNVAAGVVFLVLGIAGLFVVGTPFNVLALNTPDHVLHFAGAVVLLGVGLGAGRGDGTRGP